MECGIGLCGHCQMGKFFVCGTARSSRSPSSATPSAGRGSDACRQSRPVIARASRPRVGVIKFASCDGCQLTVLDLEDHLLDRRRAVRHRRVPRGDLAPLAGPFDVLLVEGSISTAEQAERDRASSGARRRILVTIGACATRAGSRRSATGRTTTPIRAAVYAHPEYVESLATVHAGRRARRRSTPSCAAARSTRASSWSCSRRWSSGRRPQLPDEARLPGVQAARRRLRRRRRTASRASGR